MEISRHRFPHLLSICTVNLFIWTTSGVDFNNFWNDSPDFIMLDLNADGSNGCANVSFNADFTFRYSPSDDQDPPHSTSLDIFPEGPFQGTCNSSMSNGSRADAHIVWKQDNYSLILHIAEQLEDNSTWGVGSISVQSSRPLGYFGSSTDLDYFRTPLDRWHLCEYEATIRLNNWEVNGGFGNDSYLIMRIWNVKVLPAFVFKHSLDPSVFQCEADVEQKVLRRSNGPLVVAGVVSVIILLVIIGFVIMKFRRREPYAEIN